MRACDDLRDNNYGISIRADGPGVALLPAWLKAEPVSKVWLNPGRRCFGTRFT